MDRAAIAGSMILWQTLLITSSRRTDGMFGIFGKKKRETVLDSLVRAVYCDTPPGKRADVEHAVQLAQELLANRIGENEIARHTRALDAGPIPYSTHDLAMSVALHFFKQPQHVPHLFETQLLARMKMLEWLTQGLVAPMLVQSFETTLYRIYKPD